MSQITLLPNYIGLVQNTSLNFYLKSTNILDALSNYLAEIEENIKFNKALVTTDVIKAYGELYNQLNATDFTIENFSISNNEIQPDGEKTLDNSFKLFFIEQYQSLSQQYKERVNAIITNNNYFINFSDDIAYITDIPTIMDNNVSPYFDKYNAQNMLAINIPNTINNKITRTEKIMLKTFSYYTDAMLKVNLQGLQAPGVNSQTARTAHGTNLITDILYFNRAVANQQAFLTEIQTLLGDISSFIFFFKDLNLRDKDSERKAVLYNYTITNLEGLEARVDGLKNYINKLSLSTKNVLSVA